MATAILAAGPAAHAGDTLRVLFIGNSYTAVNNLPQLIGNMAASAGHHLIQQSSIPGGYTFQQHSSNPTTLGLIAQGGWDFVVLQEQSQLPAFPDAQVAAQVTPYARKLDSLVQLANPCAKTVFYMTWGRKNGDAGNCGFFPPLCTYVGMDSMLQLRYTQMAVHNNAVISPVAKTWRRLRSQHPSIELYDMDESHPSLAGSYAAAATFYAILFRQNPAYLSFNGGLNASQAATIRSVAGSTVYDSLDSWYAYDPVVEADFSYTKNGHTVQFTNSSVQATDQLWLFGDGQSSTASNPAHTYAGPGNYTVRLIARNCNLRDTSIQQIAVGNTNVQQQNTAGPVQVYPNPARGWVAISAPAAMRSLQLLDLSGRCLQLHRPAAHQFRLELAALPAGIYLLRLELSNGQTVWRKLEVE